MSEPGNTNIESGGGPSSTGAKRTTAWFSSFDQVRGVELELERRGVDPVHISTQRPAAVDNRNDIDEQTTRWAAGRTAIGLVAGIVAGAVIGAVVSLVFVDSLQSTALFALGGAIFGATVGFFYGFALNLPANPEVFDTLGADDGSGSHWIAVGGTESDRRTATEVMRGFEPTELVDG